VLAACPGIVEDIVGDKGFVSELGGLTGERDLEETRLFAASIRLAEIRASTLSAIGSCEEVLGVKGVLGVCPARIEFKVCLPLTG